jgi:serine/threonine protein kinase
MTVEPPANDGCPYSRLGKYEVVAHLASGGMGAVYKAVDVDFGREVALKVLSPELASKPALMERFQREAHHIAKLHHHNIVKMYEFGEADGVFFIVLEYVDGIDLYDYICRKGQLEVEESVLLLTQATRALDHLHHHRMVHRDIKPSNFLLTRENGRLVVKLTDLGLARMVDEAAFRVTRDGSTVGTIDYIAPEQARDSASADIRSDIYSLGCTWFHMLAGRPPFAEGGLAERLYKHLNVEPPDIRQFNPQVAPALANVLRRMLAKRQAERYQTPALLLRDLVQEASPQPAAPPVPPPVPLKERPPTPRGAPKTSVAFPSRETPHEVKHMVRDTSPLLSVSPEQQQAAAGQFERAKEVITAGNFDYGIHLLLTCCKLDPANLVYRRVLRRTERARHKERRSRLSFLTMSATRAKLKKAKAAHKYLKVLELGEELLTRDPWDNGTQMAMAEAAEALGLLDVAVWILKHAWQKEAPDLTLGRTLARMYEKRGRFREAIAMWEWVHHADPHDVEASRKSRDLAASDTIARGQYGEERE